MSPRASVLLPFRNAAPTLPEALSSLLAEEGDYEVVAVDDGSSDEGASIVAEWSRIDGRVRLVRTPPLGLVAALNRALAEATAPIILRMDADDVHHPPRLTATVAALEADPSIGLVGTRVEILSDEPVGAGLRRYVDWQNGLLDRDSHAREVFVESPVCHPTFGIRTTLLRELGGYRDGPFPEDYDLVLRVHARGLAIEKLGLVGLSWRHTSGRLTFRDPRYGTDAFRALKAEHLEPLVASVGRPLVLWGAGRDGRRFARTWLERGLPLARLVDIAPAKIGRTAQGRPIVGPDALTDPSAGFVVACVGTAGARALIRADLERRGYVELADFRCLA